MNGLMADVLFCSTAILTLSVMVMHCKTAGADGVKREPRGVEWWRCGKILLPDHYQFSPARNASHLDLSATIHGEENDTKPSVRVIAVVGNGDLFCKCGRDSAHSQAVDVTFPLSNKTHSFSITANLAVPCNNVVALCQRNPTSLLFLPLDTKFRILHQRSDEDCKLPSIAFGRLWRGGVAGVLVNTRGLVSVMDGGVLCSYAKIELITNVLRSTDGHSVSGEINLYQVIPFDVQSCVNYVKVAIPLLITLRRSIAPQLLKKQVYTDGTVNGIHALPDAIIHRVGVSKSLAHLHGDFWPHFGTSHKPPMTRVQRQAMDNHPPQFVESRFHARIAENVPQGTAVLTIQAQDDDTGSSGKLSYSLTTGRNELFVINSTTGLVRTNGVIDRERNPSYNLTVTVQDGGGLRQSTSLEITVLDQNDNTPTFQDGTYFNVTLPENHSVGARVHTFSIIDEDIGSNALLSYELVNNTASAFSVRSDLQTLLLLAQPLDYETLAHYHMILIVRDRGNPSRSSSATIDVHLVNVADNLPQFDSPSYSARMPENASVGSTILTLRATSADAPPLDRLVYHIAEGNNNLFRLNESTAQLTLQMSLDYEMLTVHNLRVQVLNEANTKLSADVSVVISVININDHTPIFNRMGYGVSVQEGSPEGTYVTVVSAQDADRGTFGHVTYSFSNETEQESLEAFSVDARSGVVVTRRPLDREQRMTYQFTMEARDGGNPARSSFTIVMIHVTDVNDERPMFPQREYRAEINESNTAVPRDVIRVQARDTDSNQLMYFIQSGNIGNSFSIDDDGNVRTGGVLDREVYAHFTLIVVASDGMLESNATIFISVLDINDQRPLFQPSLYTQSVHEGVGVTEDILRVTAHDRDEGSNGDVIYSLESTVFRIDPESGVIRLRTGQRLDYERPSIRTYQFNVFATDGGVIPLRSSARVLIHVQDDNDNPPQIANVPPSKTIRENLPPLTPVVQVTATDSDSAANAQIRFWLSGDVQTLRSFGIRNTGSVYTTRPLDREVQQQYHLTIHATDSGTPPLSDTAALTVTVQDVIDDPPTFSQRDYSFFIISPQPERSVLGSLVATTRDDVPSSSIRYSIISGGNASLFSLEETTGRLVALKPIDVDADSGSYVLQVRAQHQSLSNSVTVALTIMRDDGIPRLHPLTIYFNAYLTLLPRRSSLGRLQVVQPRQSVVHTFSLHSSEPSVHKYFRVTPSTGVLSLFHTVPSGIYFLNASAATPTGVGYGSVTVYVHIITNATLDNAVVVGLPGIRDVSFAIFQLDLFASFVADLVRGSREQVEVFGVQMSREENREVVEVGVAVRSHDFQSYISSGELQGLLYAHSTDFLSSSLEVATESVCSSNTCPNLQQCRPTVHAHSYTSSNSLKSIDTTELIHHSHPFSLARHCMCPPGYSRHDLCNSEVDECSPNPCGFGAKCVDLIDDYQCECPSRTSGKNCSVVCPSESCDPCEPNPCLYGTECRRDLSSDNDYTCSPCPWEEKYTGPNCELTTLGFIPGAFLVLPTLPNTAGVHLALRFSTIAPNGLLLYNGCHASRTDFIALELVVGQVQVGVSFGGVATVLTTASEQRLNDGKWHQIELEIRNRVVMLTVSGCSRERQHLEGAERICRLTRSLSAEDHRILDLTTFLYIGGLESRVSSSNPPLSSVSFDGCISSLQLNHRLVDLNAPLREGGTHPGCSPLEVSCDRQCPGKDCVEVWNGTLCNCDGNPSLCQDTAVQLNSGFIHIQTTPITINTFHLSVRTRHSSAILVSFGGVASLELRQGNVMYRRMRRSTQMMYSAITLVANAFIDDGQWHQVELSSGDSFTLLSVDDGRVLTYIPEGGSVLVDSLTLGAEGRSSNNSSGFSGCLKDLIINNIPINLTSALTSQHTFFTITHMGAVEGCGLGTPCNSAPCPSNTVCIGAWQDHTCVCPTNGSLVFYGGQCQDPCRSNPCQNAATCSVSHSPDSAPFFCHCGGDHSGQVCNETGCTRGFFSPTNSPCQPCSCNLHGVQEGVCNGEGACLCKPELHLFNKSGDLGCRSCDCDPMGAVSPVCAEGSGQCRCRANVTGRRCDQCLPGTSGLDSQGCRAAIEVRGSFILSTLRYRQDLADPSSLMSQELVSGLRSQMERELYQFGLSHLFQVSISSMTNRSGLVNVDFSVASYMARNSTHLPRPSNRDLAGVLQVIFESGRVGVYPINSSSYSLMVGCTHVPEICDGCPAGQRLDVLICRAVVSCNGGGDLDRDGVPDACDNCPYVFNPQQNPDRCQTIGGVCPGGLVNGILWSATSAEVADHKPCPSPLIGYATRRCDSNSSWEEVNLIGCLSVEGQLLLAEVKSLEAGRILSLDELRSVADTMATISAQRRTSAGDVKAAGKLLSQLILQLEGQGEGMDPLIQSLARGASNLLHPDLSLQWMGVVEGVEFESGDFLMSLEQLVWAVSFNTSLLSEIRQENLLIKGESLRSHDNLTFDLNFNESTTSISIEGMVTPASFLTFGLFPTLGNLLPKRSDFDISRMTVATPILSVQATDGVGSEFTQLTVNLTLPYLHTVTHQELLSEGVCASWHYGGSDGWTASGCQLMETTSSRSTCQCSHLTAFALLLPEAAFRPLPAPVEKYRPEIFTYVVFGCVALFLVAMLLVLVCVRAVQGLTNSVHKNLVFSLLLATLVFVVGIDRTEVKGVCGAFGVLLMFGFLAPLCWMLADILLTARFLLQPSPKPKFLIKLYIIGWILPVLLCGIPVGILAIVSQPFLSSFAHPRFCWLVPGVVWAYVVPALFLLLLYSIALIFCLVQLCKLLADQESALNTQKIRSVLCVSVVTVVLYVLSLSMFLIGVYVLKYLEYGFVILYATLTVFLFIVLCLNKKIRETISKRVKGREKHPPERIDFTFPTGPVRVLQADLRTHPPRHPPPPLGHQDSSTWKSNSTATPTDFQRELALLSHEDYGPPHHHQEDDFGDVLKIATLPPHPPPLSTLPPPPSAHPHRLPNHHHRHKHHHHHKHNSTLPVEGPQQPWFSDAPLSSIDSGSEGERSYLSDDLEDEEENPPPLLPPLSDLNGSYPHPNMNTEAYPPPPPAGEHIQNVGGGDCDIDDALPVGPVVTEVYSQVKKVRKGDSHPQFTTKDASSYETDRKGDSLWYRERDSCLDPPIEQMNHIDSEQRQSFDDQDNSVCQEDQDNQNGLVYQDNDEQDDFVHQDDYNEAVGPEEEDDMHADLLPLPYESAVQALPPPLAATNPMLLCPFPPSPDQSNPTKWWSTSSLPPPTSPSWEAHPPNTLNNAHPVGTQIRPLPTPPQEDGNHIPNISNSLKTESTKVISPATPPHPSKVPHMESRDTQALQQMSHNPLYSNHSLHRMISEGSQIQHSANSARVGSASPQIHPRRASAGGHKRTNVRRQEWRRSESYHSNGPHSEGNKVTRNADGSETVESLV